MPKDLNAIPLGKTYYNGRTIDTSNYEGIGLEGTVHRWDRDDNPTTPTQVNTNQEKISILVRNTSGIALLPGRIGGAWVAGSEFKRLAGYSTTTAAFCSGVIDPKLPSTGVPNGDLFNLMVQGPCLVRQALSNFAADVAVNDWLFAITGATSQCTTSGRFDRYVGTFGDTHTTNGTQFNIMMNGIGRALSTSLTSNTNGNVLVNLKLFNR